MFSMASMTDVIFLLLIFFMVTSTFVFPSALEVNLPQSSEQSAIKPGTRVFIDKEYNPLVRRASGDPACRRRSDKEYNIYASVDESEPKPLPADQLMGFLKLVQQNSPEKFVALYADEEVPYGKIVDILDKGSRCGLKIVLATKPASSTYAAPEPDEAAAEEALQ